MNNRKKKNKRISFYDSNLDAIRTIKADGIGHVVSFMNQPYLEISSGKKLILVKQEQILFQEA